MKNLLYCMASWCGHCKQKERDVIKPLQQEFGADWVAIVDVWENPAVSLALNINKIPATYLIDLDKQGPEKYQRVDHLAPGALKEELSK